MSDEQIDLQAEIHRAQFIIDALRNRLHQTTEALVAQEVENALLRERIEALTPKEDADKVE